MPETFMETLFDLHSAEQGLVNDKAGK